MALNSQLGRNIEVNHIFFSQWVKSARAINFKHDNRWKLLNEPNLLKSILISNLSGTKPVYYFTPLISLYSK